MQVRNTIGGTIVFGDFLLDTVKIMGFIVAPGGDIFTVDKIIDFGDHINRIGDQVFPLDE